MSEKLDWFKHPTKLGLWIATILFLLAAFCFVAAATDLFQQRFDPSPLPAIPVVGAFWAVTRLWANYYGNKKDD